MIEPGYVQAMAAYNTEMNRRIYEAAARLDDDARKRDRGAFWNSIQGTLSHLLFADRIWLSRFDVGDPPAGTLATSGTLVTDFDTARRLRAEEDATIEHWAEKIQPEDLSGTLEWWSAASQQHLARPRKICIMQFFNHQTHHRGQVHAMITAAGETTEDTDLPYVLPERFG